MNWVVVFSCAALGCGLSAIDSAAQKPAGDAPASGVIHVFNGKDLGGFYTFLKGRGRDVDPLKVFSVQDGVLRISGEEFGCVTSVEEFENFRLVVEFKWGDQTCAPRETNARDSGVLVHSVGEDGAYGGMWMHAIECQVIEGGTGDLLVVGDGTDQFALTGRAAPELSGGCPVYQPDGKPVTLHEGRLNWFGRDPEWKDVKDFRGKNDVEKPVGEWNVYECVAQGSEIAVLLNGVEVNRCYDVRPQRGRIQIQSEGAEILVRRVEVIPLAASASPKPNPQK